MNRMLGELYGDPVEVGLRFFDPTPQEYEEDWRLRFGPRRYSIAIVGSRRYTRMDHFRTILDPIMLSHLETGVMLVSGGAIGADSLAEQYAEETYTPIVVYLPLWDRYGKAAAYIRNKKIIDSCDEVIAFWDMKSQGTKMSIELATQAGKPIKIVNIRELLIRLD